ncbi:TIGR00269 family protein [Candidatus Woesearchaeota archaeon]|nr:TIGR00269 family protein [Candidatus Woesearchaeota archaeon]
MACKKCKEKPVITLPNNNISLCKSCFIKYFEAKVRKTVRQYNLFEKGESIAVGVSGGKDSLTTLHVLNDIISKQRTTKIIGILIDEGIHGYRDESIKTAQKYCDENNIKLHIYSFEDEFGYKLGKALKILDINSCSICGVFRRYLMNKAARELKVDRIATGHNLDDESQSIVMNTFRNTMETSARLGPITGIQDDKKFIKRIKPLYFLTEKEIMTYAFIKGLTDNFNECPYAKGSLRSEVRTMINDFDKKYPSTKYSIVNSFLEILPSLKEKYAGSSIKICKCGEPASNETCQACEYVKRLKNG